MRAKLQYIVTVWLQPNNSSDAFICFYRIQGCKCRSLQKQYRILWICSCDGKGGLVVGVLKRFPLIMYRTQRSNIDNAQ